MPMAPHRRRRKSFCIRCLGVAVGGSINGALNWGGIFGAVAVGVILYLMGYEMTFAANILGGAASAVTFAVGAWILIFALNLCRAPGIVRRRDKPLLIMFGSEEPFYKITENENIVDQTVSVELKNISDVRVRHSTLQITNIQPAIARAVPIFIGTYPSMDQCEIGHIQIAYFKKTKKAPTTRWFGICVPLAPIYGGNILTIQEGSYDITIDASCDEAEESNVRNFRLWIDERDALRLTAR